MTQKLQQSGWKTSNYNDPTWSWNHNTFLNTACTSLSSFNLLSTPQKQAVSATPIIQLLLKVTQLSINGKLRTVQAGSSGSKISCRKHGRAARRSLFESQFHHLGAGRWFNFWGLSFLIYKVEKYLPCRMLEGEQQCGQRTGLIVWNRGGIH